MFIITNFSQYFFIWIVKLFSQTLQELVKRVQEFKSSGVSDPTAKLFTNLVPTLQNLKESLTVVKFKTNNIGIIYSGLNTVIIVTINLLFVQGAVYK